MRGKTLLLAVLCWSLRLLRRTLLRLETILKDSGDSGCSSKWTHLTLRKTGC